MHSLIYHISETVSPAINYFAQQEKSHLTFIFFFILQLKTLLLLLGHKFKFHSGWERLNISMPNSIYLVNNRTDVNVHFFRDTCIWLSCSLHFWSLSHLHCHIGNANSRSLGSPWLEQSWSQSQASFPKWDSPSFLALPTLSSYFFERGHWGSLGAIPPFKDKPRLKNSPGLRYLRMTEL